MAAQSYLSIFNVIFRYPKVDQAIRNLSSLSNPELSFLVAKAKEILLYSHFPSWKHMNECTEKQFHTSISTGQTQSLVKEMINKSNAMHVDTIPALLFHPNSKFRYLAMEIYAKRMIENVKETQIVDRLKGYHLRYLS